MANGPTVEESTIIVRDLLDLLKGPMKAISTVEWSPPDGLWTLIIRSILVRQYEALETILDLIRSERAHLCVPLLRPAVEEYLWLIFLLTLSSEDREEFITAKALVDAFETLQAQWNDAGTDVMIQLGFTTAFLGKMKASSEEGLKRLQNLAMKLKWTVGKKPIPSTWFIAQKTGNKPIYSLIYHATSRTVHFTPAELLRRTWGNAKKVTVSSEKMDGYWASFSLSWAPRILLLIFLELSDEFERLDINFELDDALPGVMKRFVDLGRVPIITPEEMNLRRSQQWE